MSLYAVLEIAANASTFELEQAYRTRSLQFVQLLDSRDHREFYAVSDAFQSEYGSQASLNVTENSNVHDHVTATDSTELLSTAN